MGFDHILLDMAMAALVVLVMYISIKRGFIKSFLRATKLIFVIMMTSVLGGYLVGICEELFVIDMFRGKISPLLVEKVQASGGFDFDALISGLPSVVQNVIPTQSLNDYCASLSGSAVDVAQKMGSAVEGFLIMIVAKIIAYAITFILSYILLSILIKLVDKVLDIQVFSVIDKVFSFVWGIANSYIYVSIAIFIVMLVFGRELIEGSYISRFIYKYGLFTR